MDKETIKKLSNFDFYSGNRQTFYSKMNDHTANLVHGEHWNVSPLVTILIPTFRRPQLLKEAIESALNQEGVSDYQIIVADNEGQDINVETETSKLMDEYRDNRVIYYRYDKPVDYKMDSIVALAKSKWICFLHDDDVLSTNYLSIMLQIINNNSKITYLACNIADLENEITKEMVSHYSKIRNCEITIQKAIKKGYYFHEDRANWLGAFINRKNYIDMGGISTINCGIGDHIMVGKYNVKYGVYRIINGPRLYFRRIGGLNQISSKGNSVWTDCYTSELYFYLYLSRREHCLLRQYYEYKSVCTIDKVNTMLKNGPFRLCADLDEVYSRCMIQNITKNKKVLYEFIDLFISFAYEKIKRTNSIKFLLSKDI